MGLFKKLFSGDPEALARKADALFDAGDFGPAKLAYEKAIAAAPQERRAALEPKIQACTDGIARQRLQEARAYLDQGSIELAAQEIAGAIEVASSDEIRAEAQALLDGLEASDAREQARTEEMTDEERIALLMGQWEDPQAEEYEAYGEPLLDALLALHREELEDARGRLEALVEGAPEPRYLWLEVGKARLLTDDVDAGREAFERFLGLMSEGEAIEARLAVHLALARLADEDDRFEEAMKCFQAAVETVPEDYRPYLAMGAFLRSKGHAGEALEVLGTALELSKNAATDWRLFEELGLASQDAGKPQDALKFLEQVIEFFTQRQFLDFPPQTTGALATLYEDDGRLERAADMYRALSRGGDKENHARYHYEAGRLLLAANLSEEARRMLTRAEALTGEDDGELRESIAALLQADA